MHQRTPTPQNRQIQFNAWGQKYYVPSSKDRLISFLLNYAKGGDQTRLLDWLGLIMVIKGLIYAD